MSKKQVPSYLGKGRNHIYSKKNKSYQASTGSDEPDLAACLKIQRKTTKASKTKASKAKASKMKASRTKASIRTHTGVDMLPCGNGESKHVKERMGCFFVILFTSRYTFLDQIASNLESKQIYKCI